MLCGFAAEFHLRIDQNFTPFIRLFVSSVRLQDMSFYIIAEFQIQHMQDLFLDGLIFHRKNDLHTTIKVTWHPVRAAHVYLI